MKAITSILTMASGISFSICQIWVIVSFLMYLFKDIPFNWLVFWVGIASLGGVIVFGLLGIFATELRPKKK